MRSMIQKKKQSLKIVMKQTRTTAKSQYCFHDGDDDEEIHPYVLSLKTSLGGRVAHTIV